MILLNMLPFLLLFYIYVFNRCNSLLKQNSIDRLLSVLSGFAVCFSIDFKIFLNAFKLLYGLVLCYISDFFVPYDSAFALRAEFI